MLSVGSRKDWDEYLQKCFGKVTSAPTSSVVIKEIIESLTDSGSSNSGKGQTLPAIEGFTPLVLALPTVTEPASSSVQEGIAIVPRYPRFRSSYSIEAYLKSLWGIRLKSP